MKNRMFVGLVAAATALVLSSSLAAAEDFAYSANAIGVIRKTIPAGKMMLLSIPLDNPSSTNAAIPFLQLPFLSSLPSGSSVNIWDSNNSKWLTANKIGAGWAGSARNESIQSGQSIFVKNGGSSEVSLLLSGDVPSEESISVALASAGQLQACANPYPVPFVFKTSSLASNAVNGSSVNFWDVEAGGTGAWVTANKMPPLGNWVGSGASYEVQPAEGFMIKHGATATAGRSWTVAKPYVWPDPAE